MLYSYQIAFSLDKQSTNSISIRNLSLSLSSPLLARVPFNRIIINITINQCRKGVEILLLLLTKYTLHTVLPTHYTIISYTSIRVHEPLSTARINQRRTRRTLTIRFTLHLRRCRGRRCSH